MELQEILAISGQPGLFKYVAQSTNGIIVEALADGKRMNASASSRVLLTVLSAIFSMLFLISSQFAIIYNLSVLLVCSFFELLLTLHLYCNRFLSKCQ